MAKTQDKAKPKRKTSTNSWRGVPVSVAIKPGSYEEYLWNHPEELRRLLLERGIDPDDDSTLGVIHLGTQENQSDKKNP